MILGVHNSSEGPTWPVPGAILGGNLKGVRGATCPVRRPRRSTGRDGTAYRAGVRGSPVQRSATGAGTSSPPISFSLSPFLGPLSIGQLWAPDEPLHRESQLLRHRRPESAFPDHSDPPPAVVEAIHRPAVPRDVGGELLRPELGVRLRCGGLPTARMTMPEAAVDEHHGMVPRKDQVGSARKAAIGGPVPQTTGVEGPAQDDLGLAVGPRDGGHDPRSNGSGDGVGHAASTGSVQGVPDASPSGAPSAT